MHLMSIRRRTLGPDGLGKLGGHAGQHDSNPLPESITYTLFRHHHFLLGPRWAIPIKARVGEANQARAINEAVNALKLDQSHRSPNKNLKMGLLRSFPRTIISYPSLKGLSYPPLQRWRGPYWLKIGLKTLYLPLLRHPPSLEQ